MQIMYAFLLSIFTFSMTNHVSGQAILYPAPNGIKPSNAYKVNVDGRKAFVYQSTNASYVAFDIKGSVRLTIKVNQIVKRVSIKPGYLNIVPEFSDSVINIIIQHPEKIRIQLNNNKNMPLFIFANRPSQNSQISKDPYFQFDMKKRIFYAGLITHDSNHKLLSQEGDGGQNLFDKSIFLPDYIDYMTVKSQRRYLNIRSRGVPLAVRRSCHIKNHPINSLCTDFKESKDRVMRINRLPPQFFTANNKDC